MMWLKAATLNSDSEIIRPAMNAPSARDIPVWLMIQAIAKQMTITLRRNISWLFIFAEW